MNKELFEVADRIVDDFLATRGTGSTRSAGEVGQLGDHQAIYYTITLENMPQFAGEYDFEGKPFSEWDTYKDSIQEFLNSEDFEGYCILHDAPDIDFDYIFQQTGQYVVAFHTEEVYENGWYQSYNNSEGTYPAE